MNTNHIYSIANFKFKKDKIKEVKAGLEELIEVSKKEQGCVDYYYLQSLEDPTVLMSFEVWETQTDIDAHIERVQKSSNKVFTEYLDGMPTLINYQKVENLT